MNRLGSTLLLMSILLCSFVFQWGCGKKQPAQTRIEGSAFVTLKSGQSQKLGGIPVYLVNSNSAVRHFKQVQDGSATKFAELKKQLATVTDELTSKTGQQLALEEEHTKWTKKQKEMDEFVANNRKMSLEFNEAARRDAANNLKWTQAELAEYKKNMAEITSRIPTITSNISKIATNLTITIKKLETVKKSCEDLRATREQIVDDMAKNQVLPLLQGQQWPDIVFTTTTDADGNFVLSAPAGTNLMVVSFGQREFLGNKEDYFWMLPLPAMTGMPMLLNNLNMSDSIHKSLE